MQFIKANWVSLLCGAASLAGIVLAVLGMTQDKVKEEMAKRTNEAAAIASLTSSAQNEDTIAAEKERARKSEEEYNRVLAEAERINERPPILEGVFPTAAELSKRYRFREEYQRKLYELPRALYAGTVPTEREIMDEIEILAEEARRAAPESESGLLGGAPAGAPGTPPGAPPAPPPGTRGGTRGGVGPGLAPGGAAPGIAPGRGGGTRGGMMPGAAPGRAGGGGPPPTGGVPGTGTDPGAPEDVSRADAFYRAMVKKSRNVRVYIDPMESLHVTPLADESDTPPSPADMWYSQVSLWVQQDLLNAIREVNEVAARHVGETQANVTTLPVKRVESVNVLGYMTASGLVPFPIRSRRGQGFSGDNTPVAGPSFTGAVSDERFDVVRVVLVVIADARDLPPIIDAVSRSNFYQLVSAEYQLAESMDPAGYYYGPNPVVRATLDFEGYMARKLYKEMMPPDVLTALGIDTTQQPPQ